MWTLRNALLMRNWPALGSNMNKPKSPILAKLQIFIKDLLASLNVSRWKYLSSFRFKSTHTSESQSCLSHGITLPCLINYLPTFQICFIGGSARGS